MESLDFNNFALKNSETEKVFLVFERRLIHNANVS